MLAHLLLLVLGLASLAAVHAEECTPPTFHEEALKANAEYDTTFWVINKACVNQENIIVFDPEAINGDVLHEHLPNIDVSEMQYQYQHARAKEVAAAYQAVEPGATVPTNFSTHPVSYYPIPYHLAVRYAASGERPTKFSKCTVPMIIYQHWPHTFAEFMIRAPAITNAFMSERALMDSGISLVLATAAGLPLSTFNYNFLRPFSKYEPASFAEFSAALPPDAPSNHTAEGTHVRCFDKLIVARMKGGSYPASWHAGRKIADYYQSQLPKDTPWRSLEPGLMRVLIEHRPNADSRQFLELDTLLAQCNAAGAGFLAMNKSSRYSTVQCVAHVFGQGYLRDMAVLNATDVLVTFHGSGECNILFMQEGSSLLEVRPRDFGTKHKGWPNMWFPLVSHQTGFKFFWWGLNVEDPELSPAGALEAMKMQNDAFAARDRHVHLKWEHLQVLLTKIAEVDRSMELYKPLWQNGMLYQIDAGGKLFMKPESLFSRRNLRAMAGATDWQHNRGVRLRARGQDPLDTSHVR